MHAGPLISSRLSATSSRGSWGEGAGRIPYGPLNDFDASAPCSFCREERLNTHKTRVVIAVLAETWESDAAAWHVDAQESFAGLQARLLAYAVERPPASAADLSPAEASALVDWVIPFYYHRFRLYKHCLASRPALVLRQGARGGVERPVPARPLADGIMVASQHLAL